MYIDIFKLELVLFIHKIFHESYHVNMYTSILFLFFTDLFQTLKTEFCIYWMHNNYFVNEILKILCYYII